MAGVVKVTYLANGGVAVVTLSSPETLNALDHSILQGLLESVDAIAQGSARVLVLTAEGALFCPGGSLTDGGASTGFSDGGALPLESAARRLRASMTLSQRLHEMPQVTVCAINGGCAGAGLSIACACDLRYAVASARFCTAFVNVGLSGDFGYSYFLPRIVGAAKARELCLLGDKFSAAEALAFGLVSAIDPDVPALHARVLAIAAKLSAFAPLALIAMKRNLIDGERRSLTETLDNEATRHAQCGAHPDAHEAGLAFMEKRQPRFASLEPLRPWERSRL